MPPNETFSLLELIVSVAGLVVGVGAGSWAGGHQAAVSRFRLEDRRVLLDRATDLHRLLRALRHEERYWKYTTGGTTISTDEWLALSSAASYLDQVNRLLAKLQWQDQTAWKRVVATIPEPWIESLNLVLLPQQEPGGFVYPPPHRVESRMGESGTRTDWLPLLADGLNFDWFHPFDEEFHRFRSIELYLINPSKWKRLGHIRDKVTLRTWWTRREVPALLRRHGSKLLRRKPKA